MESPWPVSTDNPTFGGLIHTAEFCEVIRSHGIEPTGILDAGACDGRDSRVFRAEYPQARVVAVEGLWENFERYLLPLAGQIEPCWRVLAARTGWATFYAKDINGISGIYDRGPGYAGIRLVVRTTTLDDFCREINFRPDVLKIDCEGATFDILAGGMNVLSGVRAICLETESIEFFKGQKLDGDVSELLRKAGFCEVLRRAGGDIKENVSGEVGRQFEAIWSKE